MAKPNLIKDIDKKVNLDEVYEIIEAILNTLDFITNVYFKDEVDSLLNTKSDVEHSHEDYYSKEEVDTLLDDLRQQINSKSDLIHYHDDLYVSIENIDNDNSSDVEEDTDDL